MEENESFTGSFGVRPGGVFVIDELRKIVADGDGAALEKWIRRYVHELDVASGIPQNRDETGQAKRFSAARASILLGDLALQYAEICVTGRKETRRREVKLIVLGEIRQPHENRDPVLPPFPLSRRRNPYIGGWGE